MNSVKIFFVFISAFVFYPGFSQKKNQHALIIGIGNYPAAGGWKTISSDRDIECMSSLLKRQGFKDIRVVKDSFATIKGIEEAFQNLTDDILQNSGDIVVVDVSSHGEQIEDDNGDEADGLDECIVTYNAISFNTYNRHRRSMDIKDVWKDYLRDDEFGVMIDKLRSKLGKSGDVIVFMDNCHSGSGTRGDETVRGDQPPLVSDSFDANKYNNIDKTGVFLSAPVNQVNEKDLATYVVISAAKAEELDTETKGDDGIGMGSLTYAVCKVFHNLESGSTYRSVFSKIQGIMNSKVPGQHPVMEGNEVDRIFLGGDFVIQHPYCEIEEIRDSTILIKGGLFSGLSLKAGVAIYPAGTIDTANSIPLAKGVVTKSLNFRSEVTIKPGDRGKVKRITEGWVFVTSPVYAVDPVSIKIVENKSNGNLTGYSTDEINRIKSSLNDLNVIYKGVPDLLLVKGGDNDSLIFAGNGYVFRTVETGTPEYSENLKEAVQSYVQYKFLQSFVASDENAKAEVKLVPVINGKADTSQINKFEKNGQYEFHEGDIFELLISNKSKNAVYVNILDLQPDGKINPLLPYKSIGIYPEDLIIHAGERRLFSNNPIKLAPPYGTEVFKIFVSRNPLDLENLATLKGGEPRGNLNGIEQIVKKSSELATRGAVPTTSNADGTTYNLLFQIKENK